jgi:hypothetical protein
MTRVVVRRIFQMDMKKRGGPKPSPEIASRYVLSD